MNIKDLEAYSDAWNAHDIDTIMGYHTDDTIFDTGGGTRFEGIDLVRERFIEVWTELPDVRFEGGAHFVSGDRGCSQWTFCATRPDGTEMRLQGCDLFTFRDGKILLKDSLLKSS